MASRRKRRARAASRSSAAWKRSLIWRQRAGIHACELPSSSRASQAQATVQWRLTVAGEMSIASAVSSTVSPPKKRSSTSRAWLGIERREPIERLVERDEIDRSLAAGHERLVERDALARAAALLRAAGACALDQNLAHRMRRDRAEVRAVLPPSRFVLHETQIRLVDERRGLQRLAGTLAAQITRGKPPQLLVDDRQQRID